MPFTWPFIYRLGQPLIASSLHRHLKAGDSQRLWQPKLDPPPSLENVVVVIVGTKKPPVRVVPSLSPCACIHSTIMHCFNYMEIGRLNK